MQLGLARPGTAPGPASQSTGPSFSIGGLMTAKPLQTLLNEEKKAAQLRATAANNQPVIQGLAAQIRRHWERNKRLRQPFEDEMIEALRAKRGEYAPEKLSQIRAQGGSEIYMMLFATKARQFKALVGDVLMGTGSGKPWALKTSPDPELEPSLQAEILKGAAQLVAQAEMSGAPMSLDEIRQMLRDAKDHATSSIAGEARARCDRAERKIEDMLVEGKWLEAIYDFLDDLAVFKSAFIKGPVITKTPVLKWEPQADGTSEPVATFENKPQWKRVDPLSMYPSEDNRTGHEGNLIERHKLSRNELYNMIGIEGYSEDAIRQVLEEYGSGGLHEWLQIDTERAHIETGMSFTYQDELIDALQYWGKASGKMLREWGLTAKEVPDEAKEYDIEAWLIGGWVIKAGINTDPLARRPYYKDSFESVPGSFWGISAYDSMRDCEGMCQAAARSLANNLGISSGPQVWLNVDRTPTNEDITAMFPWKLWQVTSDPMGGTAPPMGFFQPQSNAAELMGVYEKFSNLADEYTGIPKYLAGVSGGESAAGRTASGMSMMITNAGKTIKKVLSSLDFNIIAPSVDGAFTFAMRYVADPDIKGDLQVYARGAMSLVVKDAAAARRNEFLQITANPFDMEIIGKEGRANILREQSKALDMDAEVIPSVTAVRLQQYQAAQQAQQAALAGPAPGQPGSQDSAQMPGANKQLMDGAPVTQSFGSKRTA